MDKYYYNEHFIDSNILLGFVLRWDHFNNDCCSYFEKKWNINTSDRVYNECETVITRYRKLQTSFLESFKKYLEKNNHDNLIMAFDRKLDQFVNIFIRNNLKKGNTFKLPESNFKKSVRNFANECRDLIKNAWINYEYESFFFEVVHAYGDAIDELEDICYDSEIVKTISYSFESYLPVYPLYKEELKEMGIHRPDDRIILDCYYFRKTEFEEDIAFITKDKAILDVASEIEGLLEGISVHTL